MQVKDVVKETILKAIKQKQDTPPVDLLWIINSINPGIPEKVILSKIQEMRDDGLIELGPRRVWGFRILPATK